MILFCITIFLFHITESNNNLDAEIAEAIMTKHKQKGFVAEITESNYRYIKLVITHYYLINGWTERSLILIEYYKVFAFSMFLAWDGVKKLSYAF